LSHGWFRDLEPDRAGIKTGCTRALLGPADGSRGDLHARSFASNSSARENGGVRVEQAAEIIDLTPEIALAANAARRHRLNSSHRHCDMRKLQRGCDPADQEIGLLAILHVREMRAEGQVSVQRLPIPMDTLDPVNRLYVGDVAQKKSCQEPAFTAGGKRRRAPAGIEGALFSAHLQERRHSATDGGTRRARPTDHDARRFLVSR